MLNVIVSGKENEDDRMHRFYLPPEQCRGDLLRLEGREAHHALHVLRLKREDSVTVLDGAGNEFHCSVAGLEKTRISLAIQDKTFTPPPSCPISLLVAVPKGRIIEDIIQKAVELGAHRIVPLLTERVITHLDQEGANHKREKWQQVAVEAIKQCGAPWLPNVETPIRLKAFLAQGNLPELTVVGSLQTKRRHPRQVLEEFQNQQGRQPASIGAWIGPEGDFSLTELQAIEASGAQPITLGHLTLRVETAAIYCLSILNYELSGEESD